MSSRGEGDVNMDDGSDIQEPDSLLDKYRTQEFSYHGMEIYSLAWNHYEKCRQENKFTDIIIQIENTQFPCHKILLDACCPYFSAYFSFSSPREQEVIHLKGVSLSGFTKLLDFMYTASLTVAADEVIDVLECADFLQLRDLVHACSGFLFQHVNSETCLRIFQLAESHLLPDLCETSWQYIQTHFHEISNQESFFQTPKDLLIRILKSKSLRVESDSVLLKSVVNWVMHDLSERKHDLSELLSTIKVTRADVEIFNEICAKSKEVYDILQSCIGETGLCRHEKVMVVVSRDTNPNRHSTNNIFFYHPKSERWTTLTSFPFEKRHHFGVTLSNNKIYLTGGVTTEVPLYDKQKQIFSEAWEYDILGNIWTEVKAMNGSRYNHSSATLQNQVYVVGGRGTRKITVRPDGEVYNCATNQWTNLPCIKEVQGIGNASLTAMDGRLYLLGGMHSFVAPGRRDVSFDTYKGAQFYDPLDNEWHELHDLGRQIEAADLRLSRTDCVAVEGFLLLIQDEPGKRLKIYNPVTKMLHEFILSHGYHKFGGCQIHNNNIVLSGGLEEQFRAHDMVHSLNLFGDSSSWKMMNPLPVPLSHHTCFSAFVDLKALDEKERKESLILVDQS